MERVIGLDTTRDASSCKNLISGSGDLIIFFFLPSWAITHAHGVSYRKRTRPHRHVFAFICTLFVIGKVQSVGMLSIWLSCGYWVIGRGVMCWKKHKTKVRTLTSPSAQNEIRRGRCWLRCP